MGKNKKIIINHDKCKHSGSCIKACPEKAIYIKDGRVTINHEKCDLDGICIAACPNQAISLEE